MKRSLSAMALVASTGLANGLQADTIELVGVVRDFKVDHPDMEYPNKNFGVRTKLVESQLGSDGKPVLNTRTDYRKGMISSPQSFGQWFNDVPGVNISIPYSIALDNHSNEPGGIYTFAVDKNVLVNGKPSYFFPIDRKGWNDTARDKNGDRRNFYFTYEIHTEFTFTPRNERDHDLVFRFTGDDDVWVFINGKLAVDIGGVHAQASAAVNLDHMASELGLEHGKTYPLSFFFAERHTTESNFRIETTLALKSVPPTTVSPLYD